VADTVRFEWDEIKNRSNQAKHGVRFEDAVLVFRDPLHLSAQDRIEGGQERWQTFGLANGQALLMVAHTIRDVIENGRTVEVIRIISARPASRRERRRYEDEAG